MAPKIGRRRTFWILVGIATAATIILALVEAYEYALVGLSLAILGCALSLVELRNGVIEQTHLLCEISDGVVRLGAVSDGVEVSIQRMMLRLEEVEARAEAARSAASELGPRVEQLRHDSAVENESAVARHGSSMTMLRRLAHEPVAQLQALDQLHARLGKAVERLPLLGGWAIDPTTALLLFDEMQTVRPECVLECGSGSSTVWIAEMLRQLGGGRLVSIEHDEHYVTVVREMVRDAGLSDWADIRHAPLVEAPNGLSGVRWYDPAAIADIDSVQILLIDGPPAKTGHQARYPALPVLSSKLAPGARVVLDDARRSEERRTVDRWRDEGLVGPDARGVQSAVLLTWAGGSTS